MIIIIKENNPFTKRAKEVLEEDKLKAILEMLDEDNFDEDDDNGCPGDCNFAYGPMCVTCGYMED